MGILVDVFEFTAGLLVVVGAAGFWRGLAVVAVPFLAPFFSLLDFFFLALPVKFAVCMLLLRKK